MMGFIKKVAAKNNFHACFVPTLAGLGKGTIWECGECSDIWTVKTCFGEYETYLDWCRTTSNGRKVPFLSAYRFPTRRQKAPTSHDLNRQHRISVMLEELEVPASVLDVISLKNPAAHAPYHGYQHLLTVALNCKEAAEYHELDRATTRALVIAALFHDYGHLLQQTVQDARNIEAAVAGAMRLLPEIMADISEDEMALVVSLIHATEFPHREAGTLAEKIIQDADMMQTLEPDGQLFLRGLGEERGRIITVEQNEAFLDTYPGNTEWGRARLHPLNAGLEDAVPHG
jgi:hypothetical protein